MRKDCPYLGLSDDPNTHTLYPSHANMCYAAKPPQPVSLNYQRECCLTESHVNCEGYVHGWDKNFPPELQSKGQQKHKSPPKKTWAFILGFLLVGIIVGILFIIPQLTSGTFLSFASNKTLVSNQQSTLGASGQETIVVMDSTPTFTLSPTMTSTSTPTNTPTPAGTATFTPGPALDTPFGSEDFKFIVHEVQPGESLTMLAQRFDTTVDVLWVINGLGERTLWVGDFLVICVGCQITDDLPKLTPVYLEERGRVEDIAQAYNTSEEQFRAWNGLGDSEIVEGERWIVVESE
jgi:LysM repeat protein